jgi:GTP diphosphokinase / guanosine-3',5'-bis(diphosphate) 3'-diphosphatase
MGRAAMKKKQSTDGIGLIIRAAAFAAWKHRKQKRKGVDKLPYINHPIALAEVLWTEGEVEDPSVIAAALLHDTIEDTKATFEELKGAFGREIAQIVEEVTDVKWLKKPLRKKVQVARASRASARAKLVKLADKICNLRDIITSPPEGWSLERKRDYFDWAKRVVDQVRGTNERLERRFDQLYRKRP